MLGQIIVNCELVNIKVARRTPSTKVNRAIYFIQFYTD